MAAKKKQTLNLSTGRPPTIRRPKSISRKSTKALINNFHLLQKRKRQAESQGDAEAASAVVAAIEAAGGLEQYQAASLQGQRHDRGGDSSHVLMQWLEPCRASLAGAKKKLRILEVGALSLDNACAKSGLFDIERIDLHSQRDGILQQDFMARPLPRDDSERFDMISLSLVLNFVPEPQRRGAMLLRTLEFLHEPARHASSSLRDYFPSLFLVLPAPCVTNSRYLDVDTLDHIMNSLSYVKVFSKTSLRLVYSLWKRDPNLSVSRERLAKKEVRPGSSRNNFAIVIN